VNLVVVAVMLLAFSAFLLGPVSGGLARAVWVRRAPRAGVLLWQSLGVGAVVSGIGAGVSLAVNRYRAGFAGGAVELSKGVFGGHPLQGLGLYDALGLTLAADLFIVLCVCFGVVTVRTVRLRARHRRLLDLVTHMSPDYPGTEFLTDERAVAYCLPGVRPRIVLSDGTVALLGADELWAVIHHERGHAQEHHGLVMLPMEGVRQLLGWVPYARYAPGSILLLLEMAADDFSARRSGRRPLAAALVEMASSGAVPSCSLAAAASDVLPRVSRLLSEDRTSRKHAIFAVGLAVGIVLLPVATAILT
jgi:Zn-dependent protease with chaperone function